MDQMHHGASSSNEKSYLKGIAYGSNKNTKSYDLQNKYRLIHAHACFSLFSLFCANSGLPEQPQRKQLWVMADVSFVFLSCSNWDISLIN